MILGKWCLHTGSQLSVNSWDEESSGVNLCTQYWKSDAWGLVSNSASDPELNRPWDKALSMFLVGDALGLRFCGSLMFRHNNAFQAQAKIIYFFKNGTLHSSVCERMSSTPFHVLPEHVQEHCEEHWNWDRAKHEHRKLPKSRNRYKFMQLIKSEDDKWCKSYKIIQTWFLRYSTLK